MKVFVYFNLHRKCWSIKALSGPDKGRVKHHATSFTVEDATFKVSEAGRKRVLRERRKNVHAGIVGQLVNWVDLGGAHFGLESAPLDNGTGISYNPYFAGHFYTRDEWRAPVHSAKYVVATGRDVTAFNIE
jgi:hypothetical protein